MILLTQVEWLVHISITALFPYTRNDLQVAGTS